jgi:hypothetical protein
MANLAVAVLPNDPFDDSDNLDTSDESSDDDDYKGHSDDDSEGACVTLYNWQFRSDSDEGLTDPIDPEPDDEYWEEDRAADAWLARHPGGTRLLYPRLFVVKLCGGFTTTPLRDPTVSHSIFSLPPELRVRVYKYYFDAYEEVDRRPRDRRAPFLDLAGKEVRRINLTSEDVELQFWLSTALLQTSRQLRFEAMPILFNNSVFTVDWLLALPRFVMFLGREGCAMVRYMDVWDHLGFQSVESCRYQKIIANLTHMPHIQHVRIVLSPVSVGHLLSWFDANELSLDGTLRYKHAVPKMRSEDIERHWPEYEILKNLKARKFTIALETTHRGNRYLEFDRNYGAYPDISELIQADVAARPVSLQVPVSSSSTTAEFLEGFEGIQPRSHPSSPGSRFGDNDSNKILWREADTLTDKTIPLYNFIRAFFHRNIYLPATEERLGEAPWRDFVSFPTAPWSTGNVIWGCAFCYMNDGHCGLHALPDQPPFKPRHPLGNDTEENVKTMQKVFEDLSYVDMRAACRGVVVEMHLLIAWESILLVSRYLDGPEVPVSELLVRLDAAADVGWKGKRVDKDEVTAWDVLYRELKKAM